MALILSLPPQYPLKTLQTYTLRNLDTNAHWPSEAIFRGEKHLHAAGRIQIDVYRGQLNLSDGRSLDVVCKIGFGKKATDRVAHEASLYNGKLSHLQGVYIPICHGYFVGDADGESMGCLLVAYCGEPIIEMFMRLPPIFKTGLVSALVAIHDAGVEHRDLAHRNILNCKGLPVIIDFDDAVDHACGRHISIVEGAPAPSLSCELGCVELYQFFLDLRVWTPAYIMYTGCFQPIRLAFDAHALAKTAPSHWSHEEALQEAYRVITAHVKEYYPAQYEAWKAKLSDKLKSKRKAPQSTSETTSPSDSPEPRL
ncbi:hypothetical protein EWM64_g4102 [Hericium alpestre]|uniref:Protein kinase domain-containing protein n=1 Tax=Hericium alpestre TaxID=135208 RepID=A0A4Z0A0Q5_9AGAM|nr:hypothetical protein EWM64_g4102 [Hericium alpestre]